MSEFFEAMWNRVATDENEEVRVTHSAGEVERREYYEGKQDVGITASRVADTEGVHRTLLINRVIPGNSTPEAFAMQHTTRDAKYRVAMTMPLSV